MASRTLWIFSASSSGISMPNSSSKRITSSTVSSESAPRSSMKRAFGVTSFSSTPSSSMMICFTFASISGSAIIPAPLRPKLENSKTFTRPLIGDGGLSARLRLCERGERRLKACSVLDVHAARLRRGLPHQPAQNFSRPDFNKCRDALARQKLDRLAPANGRRDLMHERVARLRARPYDGGAGVRHERHVQIAELDLS